MKRLITSVSVLVISTVLFAVTPPPVPQKMSYQAVIRNNSNALVTNQPIGMKISILQYSATGTAVYAETQTPTSNANGLVTIEIGTGTVVTGTFSTIDWSSGPYFIKTETDPTGGTAYTITATSELLSVPYALLASSAKSLKLPLSISENFSSTPLIINNTGTDIYTIKGISTNGTGLYGETKATNGSGVYGKGTGADASSGVTGITGEGSSEFLPGNTGVLGEANAYIGVAGTAISGTGGYFSSRSGQALFTKGSIKLTGIDEAAGSILTSDAAGIASWKAPVWAQSDYKIYYTNPNTSGLVGINTTNPASSLHVVGGLYSASEIARFQSKASSKWIALYQDNSRKGILWSVLDDIKLVSDAGGVALRTAGIDRVTITQEGKTGIGDATPEATLDVEGTMVIGSGGKIFSEIREITGTTLSTSNAVTIQYPTGYTKENIRVLSCEINYNGNAWIGLGGTQNPANSTSNVFYYLGSSIMIYFPMNEYFQNRAYRMLVVKVQ